MKKKKVSEKDTEMSHFMNELLLINMQTHSVRKLTRSASGVSPIKLRAKIQGCLTSKREEKKRKIKQKERKKTCIKLIENLENRPPRQQPLFPGRN